MIEEQPVSDSQVKESEPDMIDTFTKQEFEEALPRGWKYAGFDGGEYTYLYPVDVEVGILIRSSVGSNGYSADAGEDSIRIWLVRRLDESPLGSKLTRWVTRQPHWHIRLENQIKELVSLRQRAGNCSICNKPKGIFITKKDGPNKGRPFAKCSDDSHKSFVWLDQPSPVLLKDHDLFSNPYPSPVLLGASTSSEAKNKSNHTESADVLVSSGTGVQPVLLDGSAVVPDKVSSFPLPGADAALSSSETGEVQSSGGLSFLKKPASPVVPVAKKEFVDSSFQIAFYDCVKADDGHIRLDARAGSGKTTTGAKSCSYIPSNQTVFFMVFAKSNQLDMAEKVPSHVRATTAHAAGYADIRRAYPSVKLDEKKMWALLGRRYEYNDGVKASGTDILKLVSLCKNTLRAPTPENLDWLCDRFGINPNGNLEVVYAATAKLYQDSLNISDTVVDYDDMLLVPALGRVAVEQADILYVDEAQDTNAAQQAYYLKAVKSDGRLFFIGDEKQAIMGFRGADTEAMDNLSAALNPTRLPLSICYRCPRKVIELAQTIVPDIQAREDAPDGIVEDIDEVQFATKVKPGDMVLCRLNAPLVKPAFQLIRNGIKAVIRGRDIGKNLAQLIKKVQRRYHTCGLPDTLAALSNYVVAEEYKLLATKKENQAQMLRDQFETIVALADGCHTSDDLRVRIEGDYTRGIKGIFSDDNEGVVFSTVHKAKGLESDRVFVLKPELLNPQKFDKQEWQLRQLENLRYVCWTRAMSELYFVR